MMYGRGKSDRLIVPEKQPNKARASAAEAVEGRGRAKGKPHQQNASRTQSRIGASNALERIRRAGGSDQRHYPRQEPDAVIPHVRICGGGRGRPRFLLRLRVLDVPKSTSPRPTRRAPCPHTPSGRLAAPPLSHPLATPPVEKSGPATTAEE